MSKYEIIKGSDFFPNIDTLVSNSPVNIYFYQIAQFSDNEKTINPQLSKNSNIYNIRAYKFSKRNVDKFIEKIKIKGDVKGSGAGNKYKYINKENNNKTLYKYKFYPVYTFDETPPPQGYEINECTSELLR
jgi:hypothetical protein